MALSSVPAHAVAQEAAPTSRTVTVGMHFAGYDKKTAEANGYVIKKTAKGSEYSVKKDASPAEEQELADQADARDAAALIDNTGEVHGNCGSAWITLTGNSNHHGQLSTGFEIFNQKAWWYEWGVSVVDVNGSSHQGWGPSTLNFQSQWSGSRSVTLYGSAYATIIPGDSYAELADGTYCTAGPASAYDWFG
ncbi:hypothetical protein [Kitasatospora sp. NPDC093806]|uniref:hypothetical protein n=1 Tax=Kitasatospora sp. NPDC093806 TaxID=3155075 RepID=UPI003427E7B6